MVKAVKVIINEQHKLLMEQQQILRDSFGEFEVVPVPAQGWTLEDMKAKINEIAKAVAPGGVVIFASPIPYMIKELGVRSVKEDFEVKVFHNDRREKKELPDGRIIQVVAQEGWQLVQPCLTSKAFFL